MNRLKNKVAVITGAASGFGAGMARRFAEEGAKIVVADINARGAEQVASEIGKAAVWTRMDVSLRSDFEEMTTTAMNAFGRIDIMVNNAGFTHRNGDMLKVDEATFDLITAINMKAIYHAAVCVVPIMEKQGGGSIVNTASTVAIVGITDRAAYVASKGAVAALTRAMALDHVKANIRVNCVAPGTIESPYFTEIFAKAENAAELRRSLEQRQAMERLGKPIEIARAILFLASDESSFCTGTTLVADGGWTAR